MNHVNQSFYGHVCSGFCYYLAYTSFQCNVCHFRQETCFAFVEHIKIHNFPIMISFHSVPNCLVIDICTVKNEFNDIELNHQRKLSQSVIDSTESDVGGSEQVDSNVRECSVVISKNDQVACQRIHKKQKPAIVHQACQTEPVPSTDASTSASTITQDVSTMCCQIDQIQSRSAADLEKEQRLLGTKKLLQRKAVIFNRTRRHLQSFKCALCEKQFLTRTCFYKHMLLHRKRKRQKHDKTTNQQARANLCATEIVRALKYMV